MEGFPLHSLGEKEGWGVPPAPPLLRDPRDPHDPRDPKKGDYKSARATTLHLSQIVCCCVELWWFATKMADPRMRVAGEGIRTLDNPINVHRLENMSVGYPEERTRLDGHPIQSTSPRNLDLKYLRRCRRTRLTQKSVNGFINNYCFIMSDEENCFECVRRQRRVMGEMLEKQFLPWIRDNLIDCLDADRWPLEMILFKALDDLLLDKFPKIRSGSCWQAITQCYRLPFRRLVSL